MSTDPTPTRDSPTTERPTTAVAARGRTDPWTDDDAPAGTATGRVQRQFEPYSLARLRNLIDGENAYCN